MDNSVLASLIANATRNVVEARLHGISHEATFHKVPFEVIEKLYDAEMLTGIKLWKTERPYLSVDLAEHVSIFSPMLTKDEAHTAAAWNGVEIKVRNNSGEFVTEKAVSA